MLKLRVIPTLLHKDFGLVKGVGFDSWRRVGSAMQAVARVALRVKLGGHHVPEDDVRRRFDRSRRHFLEDYLPLADEWVLWENAEPPSASLPR